MAGSYEVVPYLVHLHVSGSASEVRPIGDLDLKGASLHEAISRVYHAATGVSLQHPSDKDRRQKVRGFGTGKNTIFARVEPGISGIRSVFDDDSGQVVFERDVKHTENLQLRQAFVFPSGATFGWLLVERVAGYGTVSLTSLLLKKNLQGMFPPFVTEIAAAMDEQILRKSIADSPVKSFRFVRPAKNDDGGQFAEISGKKASYEIRFKAPRRQFWKLGQLASKKTGAGDAPTTLDMMGYLAPLLRSDVTDENRDQIMSELLDQGWDPILEVKINGKTRSVRVGQEKARDLAFPIVDAQGTIVGGYPTDDEFRAGCENVLAAFAGRLGLPTSTEGLAVWGDEAWVPNQGEKWELRWD